MADRGPGTDGPGQSARAAVREIVATWPPLAPEVKAELAVIILGGSDA
jgi:hypothetical protein